MIIQYLIAIILLSNILTGISSVIINDNTYIIVEWSHVGPFPNQTEILLYENGGNVTGRIVYIKALSYNSKVYIEPFKNKLEILSRAGCLGVLTSFGKVPGFLVYGAMDDNFPIPVGFISNDAVKYIYSIGDEVCNCTFNGWDPNPWAIVFTGIVYIVNYLILSLLFLFNSILSAYCIGKWIYTIKNIDWNIGFVCLSLEWIANVLRVVQMILHPTYNLFKLSGTDVLLSLPMCITLISGILIVFFWLDLTSDPFYHGKFLGVMKIPAFIFMFFCFGIEISLDIARNTTDKIDFTGPVIAFYTLIHVVVVLFNFIAAYRVLQTLKKQTKIKESLTMIIHRIIYSGMATIIGTLVLVLVASGLLNHPWGITMLWFLLEISFFFQSIFLITVFQIPQYKNTTNSSTAKDSQDTTSAKETTEMVTVTTPIEIMSSDKNNQNETATNTVE